MKRLTIVAQVILIGSLSMCGFLLINWLANIVQFSYTAEISLITLVILATLIGAFLNSISQKSQAGKAGASPMTEKKERTPWDRFFNYEKMLSRKWRVAIALTMLAIFALVYVGLWEYNLSYIWAILGCVAAFAVYVVGAIKAKRNYRHSAFRSSDES
jgi:hypothetical protein